MWSSWKMIPFGILVRHSTPTSFDKTAQVFMGPLTILVMLVYEVFRQICILPSLNLESNWIDPKRLPATIVNCFNAFDTDTTINVDFFDIESVEYDPLDVLIGSVQLVNYFDLFDTSSSSQFVLQRSSGDASVSESQVTDEVVLTSWVSLGTTRSSSASHRISGIAALRKSWDCALYHPKHVGNLSCLLPNP